MRARRRWRAFGVPVPRARLVPCGAGRRRGGRELGFPVVIKAAGADLEHKTEVGGVVLNVRSATEAAAAAQRLATLSRHAAGRGDDHATASPKSWSASSSMPQFGQVLVLGRRRRADGDAARQRQPAAALDARRRSTAALRRLERGAAARRLPRQAGRRRRGAGRRDPRVSRATLTANLDTLVELDLNPVIVRPRGPGAWPSMR